MKTKRISLRLTDSEKLLIEKAAYLKGQSLSTYITSVITEEAQKDAWENETIVLSNEDRDFVLKLLESPLEPGPTLKALFK